MAMRMMRLFASQSDAHTIAPHRDPNPFHPYPSTYSSRAEKGQTEQDHNAGVRLRYKIATL